MLSIVMGHYVTPLASSVLVLVSLSGCEKTTRLNGEQQLVLEAVQKLRQGFNKDCESFYRAAAVRDDALKQDWISGCERIRADLGPWNDLGRMTYYPVADNPLTVLLEGRAMFGSGHYFLETHWQIANRRAHLYFFTVRGGKEEINLPRTPKRPLGPQDVPNPVGTRARSNT